MKEKKFFIPAIIISAGALAAAIFGFAAESVVLGIAGIVISVIKRENFRIKLSVILSAIAIVCGVIWLVHFFIIGTNGTGSVDYWLFELIFGKMES